MGSITSLRLANALFFLKQEECEASFLNRLVPAESLCQKQLVGSIKDYEFRQLTQGDPLFKEINAIINLLKARLSGPYSATSIQQSQPLVAFYQAYIDSVCQSKGEKRLRLLKGKEIICPQDIALLQTAREQEQDELAYSLINLTKMPFIAPSGDFQSDPLKSYIDWLIEAQEKQNEVMQCLILEKLSDFYLGPQCSKTHIYPNDYATAAEYLNSSFALAKSKKVHPFYRRHLLKKMENVEKRGLRAFCQKEMPLEKAGDLLVKRNQLQAIRQEIEDLQKKGTLIFELLAETTRKLRNFLATLIEDSIYLLEPPQTAYAFIGLGSMARSEMCPYSDIEFAILLEKDDSANRTYFRNLMRFLEIRIINMGETERCVGKSSYSPTPHGFSLDKGGNVPIGGTWELIGTPQQLATYQNLTYLQENTVTSNALTYVCLITSNEGRERSFLCENYRKAVTQQLSFNVDGSWFDFDDDKEKVYQRRALILLKGHLQEFQLNLTHEKEKEQVFGIKKEIYRILQSLIDTLALFFNLKSQSTEKRILEMVQKNILPRRETPFLLQTVAAVLMLRVWAQHFYKDGKKDYFYHPRLHQLKTEGEKNHLLELTGDYVYVLEEIYKTLYPFYYLVKRFFEANTKQTCEDPREITLCKGVNTLKYGFFYADLTLLARTFHTSCQTAVAEKIIHQAVALNPNNTDALKFITEIKLSFGKLHEADAYNEERMILLSAAEQNPNTKLAIATSLIFRGKGLQLSCHYRDAYQAYKQAFDLLQETKSENIEFQITLMEIRIEMAKCFQSLKMNFKAEEHFIAVDNLALDLIPTVVEGSLNYIILHRLRGDNALFTGIFYHETGHKANADERLKVASYCYEIAFEKKQILASCIYEDMHLLGAKCSPLTYDDPGSREIDSFGYALNSGNGVKWYEKNLHTLGSDKRRFIMNEVREIRFLQALLKITLEKFKFASLSNDEKIAALNSLEKTQKNGQDFDYHNLPSEVIIKHHLQLAVMNLEVKRQDIALQYAQKAFDRAKKENLFFLFPLCLSVMIKLFTEGSKLQLDKAFSWSAEVLATLIDVDVKLAAHYLLPLLLEIRKPFQLSQSNQVRDSIEEMLSIQEEGMDLSDEKILKEILNGIQTILSNQADWEKT